MRAFVATCLLLSACAAGGGEANDVIESDNAINANAAVTAPEPDNSLNNAAPNLEPPDDPGLAAMTPYRRREYERGWRDCMTGDYDRERQGESYRIGCMAAEEAKEEGGR